jgi:hypothetical protein
MNVKVTKRHVLTVEVIVPFSEHHVAMHDIVENMAPEIEAAAYAVVAQHYTNAAVRCRPDGPFWMENAK